MAQSTDSQIALARAKDLVNKSSATPLEKTKLFVTIAELEIRAAQVRQQELANLIAMLASPNACPYPSKTVLERIKELTALDA